MSDETANFFGGLGLGFALSFAIIGYPFHQIGRGEVKAAAVEHGHAYYHPQTCDFVWKGSEEDTSGE